MNIVLRVVDQLTNTSATVSPLAFLHLDQSLAAGLLDHWYRFQQTAKISYPRILWSTLAENSCVFLLSRSMRTPSDPATSIVNQWRERLNEEAAAIILDDVDMRDKNSIFAPLIGEGLDPHAIINEDGISWGLMLDDRPLGTLPLPFMLIEQAAGVRLPNATCSPTTP